jgi:hypothetical protein
MEFEDHLARLLNAASADLDPPIAQLREASLEGGRRRVQRRRAGAAGLGVFLACAIAAGTAVLTGPAPHARATASSHPGAAATAGSSSSPARPTPAQTVDIDFAAYSVHTDAHGALVVTLRTGIGNFDLYHVHQVLAGAGVNADFRDGYGLNRGTRPWCTAGALPPWITSIDNNGTNSVITLDPAAIPTGTVVRFILFSIVDTTASPDPKSGFEPVSLFVGARVGLTQSCVVTTSPAS